MLFFSLFEKNKNALGYFTNLLSTSTLAELRESKTLENHVKGVMLTIDEAINNMDHADTIDMLHHVGKTHTRFKDFDPKVFLVSYRHRATSLFGESFRPASLLGEQRH